MLNYAIEEIDRLGIENFVWCSDVGITDHIDSAKVKFLERPLALDADDVLGEDIYKAFAERIVADIYLLYHVTSPLLRTEYFQWGVDAVMSGDHDSAFSARRSQTFAFVGGVPYNFKSGKLPRTQDLPVMHLATSGFFVFERDVLLSGGSRLGKRPKPIEVDVAGAIDIDLQEDFDDAERLLIGATR
jgi:CMP-N-acetylneuraminic acid synthetase